MRLDEPPNDPRDALYVYVVHTHQLLNLLVIALSLILELLQVHHHLLSNIIVIAISLILQLLHVHHHLLSNLLIRVETCLGIIYSPYECPASTEKCQSLERVCLDHVYRLFQYIQLFIHKFRVAERPFMTLSIFSR